MEGATGTAQRRSRRRGFTLMELMIALIAVSYTHLTLPTNREV